MTYIHHANPAPSCACPQHKRVGGGRYAPGSQRAAEALLALRQGWAGLQRFSWIDRGAIMFSAGLLLPYTAPEDTGRKVQLLRAL